MKQTKRIFLGIILMFMLAAVVGLGVHVAEAGAQPDTRSAMAAPGPAAMAPAAPRPTDMTPATAVRPTTMAASAVSSLAPKPAARPAVTTPSTEASAASQPHSSDKPTVEKPAVKGETDPWWKVLIGHLTEILLLFASALALGLGGLLIRWVAKKVKITDQEQIAGLEQLYGLAVGFGVNYARQEAHKLGNNPDAKAKRLESALEKAQEFIEDWKLPQKTADWLRKKIEAKLGEEERKP